MKEEWFLYFLLFFAVLVLGWSLLSFFRQPVAADSSALASQRVLANTQGDDCGDLREKANVQHLSHHPERYAECLKKVEPAFLEEATGKTLQELIG